MYKQYHLFLVSKDPLYIIWILIIKILDVKSNFVNQEWMMTIAYYRGALENYKNHPIVPKNNKRFKKL